MATAADVIVAGIFGGFTASGEIFLQQALPGAHRFGALLAR